MSVYNNLHSLDHFFRCFNFNLELKRESYNFPWRICVVRHTAVNFPVLYAYIWVYWMSFVNKNNGVNKPFIYNHVTVVCINYVQRWAPIATGADNRILHKKIMIRPFHIKCTRVRFHRPRSLCIQKIIVTPEKH